MPKRDLGHPRLGQTMTARYWPLGVGRKVTSPFGNRPGGFHYGTDFGRDGGSAGMAVYAIQAGTVIHAGAAQGYGGPSSAGWLVIDSDDSQGGGCLEYGHIIGEVGVGAKVKAGQRIGYINPDNKTNGGVAPHLHVSDMPKEYNPNTKQDPMKRLVGALEPGQTAPTVPPVTTPAPSPPTGGSDVTLANPINKTIWSPNKYNGRAGRGFRWIAVHTQEGGRRAVDLANYLAQSSSQVSYNVVNDDVDIIRCVADTDAPWSAMGANYYALHICLAGSYAGWSRGKWLETDASDGKNEDLELTLAAKMVAYWCQQYKIPPVWIGGKNVPPWGLDGICGHKDFGQWGGGHTDPGPNFPVDEFIRRINVFLGGSTPTPIPGPDPVPVPGTNPDKYANVLLYRGRIGQNVAQVRELQRRLKTAYAAYAGHLDIDGDYGPMTEAAVREFQRRSGLVQDGIVGPMTAAALKLKLV